MYPQLYSENLYAGYLPLVVFLKVSDYDTSTRLPSAKSKKDACHVHSSEARRVISTLLILTTTISNGPGRPYFAILSWTRGR